MSNELNIFPIKDINGSDIHDGDTVRYNDETFVVMNITKDETSWVLHPCNNNQMDSSIKVEDIVVPLDDETVQIEIIMKGQNNYG